MAILYVGARPVFADLAPGEPNIDPIDAERRIGPRTKAILVVHYGGYPCDMDEFHASPFATVFAIIEDAAHALGATYRGGPVGSLGDFGVFSFQAIKQLTTVTAECWFAQMKAGIAKRSGALVRYRSRAAHVSELGEPEWDIAEIGFKYHMNDIAASIGLAQLESFTAASDPSAAS